jgi:hypothetical protein
MSRREPTKEEREREKKKASVELGVLKDAYGVWFDYLVNVDRNQQAKAYIEDLLTKREKELVRKVGVDDDR